MSKLVNEINALFAHIDKQTQPWERPYAPEGSHLWAARKMENLDPSCNEIYWDPESESWDTRWFYDDEC